MKIRIELSSRSDDPARDMATALRRIEAELLDKDSEFRASINAGLRDRLRLPRAGYADANPD